MLSTSKSPQPQEKTRDTEGAKDQNTQTDKLITFLLWIGNFPNALQYTYLPEPRKEHHHLQQYDPIAQEAVL